MEKMKKTMRATLLTGCFCLLAWAAVHAQSPIKVACVGNSITEGAGLDLTYPEVLQELLGEGYEVRNYGISGRTMLNKGDLPYRDESIYQEAMDWNPDIVVIKLGTNDTKPQNWQHRKDFIKDYKALVKSFQKLPSKPQLYVCYPIPVFEDRWGINEAILREEVLPAVQKVASKTRAVTIDLYTPFTGKAALTYDGIHPNEEGAALLASEVYSALLAAGAASLK